MPSKLPVTVLLVEDDPDQLAIRAMLFRQNGFAVLEAATREAGLVALQRVAVDCVVVDLGLPSLQDGIDAIQEFKAACPGLGIYVLTGTRESALPNLDGVDGTFIKGGLVRPLLAALKRRYDV